MQSSNQARSPAGVVEPRTGCPMQTPRGGVHHAITFLEYRQLQDQFIGHTCHIERTKQDCCIQEPTLRQLEEHFISNRPGINLRL
jgi:hypothetical protein